MKQKQELKSALETILHNKLQRLERRLEAEIVLLKIIERLPPAELKEKMKQKHNDNLERYKQEIAQVQEQLNTCR
mgnify:CR=1 FL=1|jgi:hypothetical protein